MCEMKLIMKIEWKLIITYVDVNTAVVGNKKLSLYQYTN